MFLEEFFEKIAGLLMGIGAILLALQVVEEDVIRKWELKFKKFVGSFSIESTVTPDKIGIPILFFPIFLVPPNLHGMAELISSLIVRRLSWCIAPQEDLATLYKRGFANPSFVFLPDEPHPPSSALIAPPKLSHELLSNIFIAYIVIAITYLLNVGEAVEAALLLLFPLMMSLLAIYIYHRTNVMNKPPKDYPTLFSNPNKYSCKTLSNLLLSIFYFMIIFSGADLVGQVLRVPEWNNLLYFFVISATIASTVTLHGISYFNMLIFSKEMLAIYNTLDRYKEEGKSILPLGWSGPLPVFHFCLTDINSAKSETLLKPQRVWILTDKSVIIVNFLRSLAAILFLFCGFIYTILFAFRAVFANVITYPLRLSYYLSAQFKIKSPFFVLGIFFLLIGFLFFLIGFLL